MSENRKLVLILGKNKGKVFPLQEGDNLIGRADPDSDEPLAVDLDEDDSEAKVSRQHAIIALTSDSATVEDLGSLNGTFVRRASLEKIVRGDKYEILPGDEIVIGKVSLRFE